MLLIGQIFSQSTRSIGQPYGGRLANLWFKRNEISKAVGVCSGGFTLGAGLGYVIPALVVVDQSAGDEKLKLLNETVSKIDYHLVKTQMWSLHSSQESNLLRAGRVGPRFLKISRLLTVCFSLNRLSPRIPHSSMTAISIIISLGLAVLYTEDPIPPNIAERKRTEVRLKFFSK